MPARCTSCGERALTDDAQFCVGCGAALDHQPPVEDQPPPAPVIEPAQPEPRAPRRARPPRPPRRRVDRPVASSLPVGAATVPPAIVVAAIVVVLGALLVLLLIG